jgi:hypothetical protein
VAKDKKKSEIVATNGTNEVQIQSEWIRRGQLTLQEVAGEDDKGPKVDLELYVRPMGGPTAKAAFQDDATLYFTIRGISLRMEGSKVTTKGIMGDTIHLHGYAELDL